MLLIQFSKSQAENRSLIWLEIISCRKEELNFASERRLQRNPNNLDSRTRRFHIAVGRQPRLETSHSRSICRSFTQYFREAVEHFRARFAKRQICRPQHR